MSMSRSYRVGQSVRFQERFSRRVLEGTYRKTLVNGNLVVIVPTRAARGGAWVVTERVVRPEQVVA